LKPKLSKLLYQASESFKKNHFEAASFTAKGILNLFPEQIDATIILLKITIKNHDYLQSEKLIKNILFLDEYNKETLLIKLQILEMKELFFEAIDTLDALLVTEPQNIQFQYKKGLNALKSGKIYLAETLLLNCYNNGFYDPFVKLNLGHIYKAKGKSDKAAEFYHEFIQDFPLHSAVGYWSLADLKDYKLKSTDKEAIQSLIHCKTLSSGNKSLLLFTLGRIHEQQEQYEKSFESIHLANQLMANYRPFQADLYSQLINDFISKFIIPPEIQTPNQEFTPIFIVGMPRSGTTLIEQILASHTEVESTDELPYIERIGLELDMMGGYIEKLKNITNEQAQKFAEQYTQQVKQYLPTLAKMVIDKNPNNFVHIGLIKTLFPQAKIINVVRNPLDNALSVYKQFFSNGHNYSYSLKGIELYWKGYLSLMNHWEAVYPKQIYQLSYERLVSDTENEIKQLLDYCQISFEKQCLTFYESDRLVLTPSVSQVKQPITARSIGSWKKYQPYITQHLPVFTELEDKANLLVGNPSKLD
jgi:tetratricopeptide (TPR) repeat protein